MANTSENKKNTCSFCGRPRNQVKMLIAGQYGNICNDCVKEAEHIVKEEFQSKTGQLLTSDLQLQKPAKIKHHLDQYIIGQDAAKKVVSVAVYNHYKRLMYSAKKTGKTNDVEIDKSNIVMVGPTGTGKTLMARTIARILNVPFCIADATVLTEAGYVGEDVESILSRLLQAAEYNVEAAERGIIFIDEIDKISRKSDNASITRDVSGEGVQQGLLKLLEGATVNVSPEGGRKHPEQKLIGINTQNILFICGGAFDGIEKIISSRLDKQTIGFKPLTDKKIDKNNLLQYVAPQDLKTYGLIPELIGRMPVVSHLDPLDADALLRILTEPKNAILKQYEALMQMDNVKLELEKDVLKFIVDKAIEYKLGARGLRGIFELIMNDAMFEAPDSKKSNIVITKNYAKERIERQLQGKAA